MKQYPSVYIPIDVKERNPTQDGWYVTSDTGRLAPQWFDIKVGGWLYFPGGKWVGNIDWWLEKQDSAIVVTKEELIALFYAGEDRGEDRAFKGLTHIATCQEYLLSKGIKL